MITWALANIGLELAPVEIVAWVIMGSLVLIIGGIGGVALHSWHEARRGRHRAFRSQIIPEAHGDAEFVAEDPDYCPDFGQHLFTHCRDGIETCICGAARHQRRDSQS